MTENKSLSYRDYGIVIASIVSFVTGIPSLVVFNNTYLMNGGLETLPKWVGPVMLICCISLFYLNAVLNGWIHTEPIQDEVFFDEN